MIINLSFFLFLFFFLGYTQHALTLIFVETKRGADALEHWLSTNGFPAIAIHGDKVQMVRSYSLSHCFQCLYISNISNFFQLAKVPKLHVRFLFIS